MAESGGEVPAAAATEGGTAGQQIDAFTAQQILQDGRIVCLEAWNQHVLLGLSGGVGWVRGGPWMAGVHFRRPSPHLLLPLAPKERSN